MRLGVVVAMAAVLAAVMAGLTPGVRASAASQDLAGHWALANWSGYGLYVQPAGIGPDVCNGPGSVGNAYRPTLSVWSGSGCDTTQLPPTNCAALTCLSVFDSFLYVPDPSLTVARIAVRFTGISTGNTYFLDISWTGEGGYKIPPGGCFTGTGRDAVATSNHFVINGVEQSPNNPGSGSLSEGVDTCPD